MTTGIIYKITNQQNGKVYIGQTIRALKVRWLRDSKKDGGCQKLYRAMNKYGIDSFTIEVLWSGTGDKDKVKNCLYKIL